MACKRKKPLGGLLTAAQIALPLLQDKFNEITAAPVVPDTTYNSNPYGKMKYGGMIPAGFTQHDSPSHDDGGQTVDAQGKPNMVAPVAEIQNKENVYNNYVYSDILTNPKTGNKFNIDMNKLARKYKNADTDLLSKSALNIAADNLAKTNDLVRSVAEQPEASQMPQAPNGIDLEPLPILPINIVPGQVGYTQEQNMNLPHVQNPFETMTGSDAVSPVSPAVPDGNNPWSGVDALPPASYTEPNYGTRPQTVLKYLKSSLNPKTAVRPYDDTAYDKNAFDTSSQPLVIDNGLGMSTAKDSPKTRNFNYNTAALVAKGLGLADSAYRAFRPAQIESPILPDYQDANAALDRATIDLTSAKQNALGVSNILGDINRATSSGFNQFRNREAGRIATLQDNISNIDSQERTMNSNLDMQRAGTRTNMANTVSGILAQNRINNQQNAASRDAFGQNFFSEISQVGTELSKYQAFRDTLANRKDIANMKVNEVIALANSAGYNFTLPEATKFLEELKAGKSPIQFNK